MKKTLLTLSLVFISAVAFSQASVGIGLKGGANFANASSDFDTDGITSYHVGAYGLIKLTNIGIQPELLFSKQGTSIDGDDLDLSYVNIPVMLKFYLPAGINLQAGPQFGMLTTAENTDGEDVKESFKNSDLSAALGAGWDAPFGLQFTARYVIGLSDINDEGVGGEFKNKTFQISIGYTLFKLGN
ncbi:Outer membrane protein beta-barrel domain-containing protein [Ekhidna lutea]|uniref:Outer membrane protein beta-barrel domain-containing protein n=1 Tax=Ekhidna lutea TaxID=447679 RepID=A0A239L327_EKHLU|nr:porin family protein [Ekhidna lutea]SNT24720.1 Outer membrane protein beta-barrel domain-containing protein [Ekhidna lutea]